jgi:hypothetical protein
VSVSRKLCLDLDRTLVMPDVTGKIENFLSFVPDKSFLHVLPKISGNGYSADPQLINFRNASLSGLRLKKILSASEVARLRKRDLDILSGARPRL